MAFVSALLTTLVQAVILVFVAYAGILMGKKLRANKNKKSNLV